MEYDIILVIGEVFFDHPLCGAAILKRLLEKYGYSVGVIDLPKNEEDIQRLGKPRLFFAVSSGSIDSMVRNYTPLKKKRSEDPNLRYAEYVPDRAVIVYCNWLRRHFKQSRLVIGGTEATMRRFTHYDYWDNDLRKSILFDSRADILIYGSAEKQILDIAAKLTSGGDARDVEGTCILSKELPDGFTLLPSHEEVMSSKVSFCLMQEQLTNRLDLAQKAGDRYVLQHRMPEYTADDLDEYYGLPFTRKVPKELAGFQFSVVTHRGCIGNCNFCSLRLMAGDKIISRSEESILKELAAITRHPDFRGDIDDLGGASANMYGMDCELSPTCMKDCIDCPRLDKSHRRILALMRKARHIPGIRNIHIRSGIRYDLCPDEYVEEVARFHVLDTLRIAPEHTSPEVLRRMNKDRGDLQRFIKVFQSASGGKELSYYFMTAHPGSTVDEAVKLADSLRTLKNIEHIQIFTPTPMTVSTCMYYTGMDPKTHEKIHVPYTYNEKKQQKRVLLDVIASKTGGRTKRQAEDDESGQDDGLNSF